MENAKPKKYTTFKGAPKAKYNQNSFKGAPKPKERHTQFKGGSGVGNPTVRRDTKGRKG